VTNSGTLYQSGWVTTYGADTLAANGSRWTTAVDGFFDAAAEPLRLAFDAEGGLWVANTHQNDGYTGDFSELQLGRIYHYDDPDLAAENRISDSVQGADVTVVLTNGNAEVYPGAMAFDNSGYLWIYDRNSSSLGRYDVASLDGDSTSLEPDIVISGVATSRGPGYLAFNPPPLDSPIHVPGQ
jgi:hypothetical protein